MKSKHLSIALLWSLSQILFTPISLAGLAITPGVSTDMVHRINVIEHEGLRAMLRAAVWPGYGPNHMNLDRPDEALTDFEKRYKTYPLTWKQKIENVQFILDNAEDLATLQPEDLTYIDIVFGEAVIPQPDRRVLEIWQTDYFAEEASKLEAQKQAERAQLFQNTGKTLQTLEDTYAAKFAALIEIENKFKQAKVDFLTLENQFKYQRISEEEFNEKTRELLQEFERFAALGSQNAVFTPEQIREIGNRIYEPVVSNPSTTIDTDSKKPNHLKYWYWGLSLLFIAIALIFGYLGFRRQAHSHHKNL